MRITVCGSCGISLDEFREVIFQMLPNRESKKIQLVEVEHYNKCFLNWVIIDEKN